MRKLGYLESLFMVRAASGHCDGCYLYSIDIKGKINPKLILKSTKLLFRKFPILRARIAKKAGVPWFSYDAKFTNIPIEILETDSTTIQSPEIMAEWMNRTLPIEEYLWNFSLRYHKNRGRIIFHFHHAIVDALTAFILTKHFFEYYQTLASGVTPKIKSEPELPTVEHLFNPKYHSKDLAINCDEIFPAYPYVKLIANTRQVARNTRNIHHTTDSRFTKKLIAKASKLNISLNSLLNAALLQTIRTIEKETTTLVLHTPLNLRKFCHSDVKPNVTGNFATMVSTAYTEDELKYKRIKTLANTYKAKLIESINHHVACLPEKVTKKTLKTIADVTYKENQEYFSWGFNLSNIGKIDLAKKYGSITLKDIKFWPVRRRATYPIFMVMYTWNNKMHWVFSFVEPEMKLSYVEKFIKTYFKILADKVSSE